MRRVIHSPPGASSVCFDSGWLNVPGAKLSLPILTICVVCIDEGRPVGENVS
jgi:hypothetical protein